MKIQTLAEEQFFDIDISDIKIILFEYKNFI